MGWFGHPQGEDSTAGSHGQSQLRLAVPSELRLHLCPLFGNWKQFPGHCAGLLAAGIGSDSLRFSKFGNHEEMPLMLAPRSKSNFKKQSLLAAS